MPPSLVDKLDFELAAKRVIVDSNTDFIVNKLGIEILKENFKKAPIGAI